MASIRKRGDKYQARIHRRGFPTLARTFLTHREAVHWARQNGLPPISRTPPLDFRRQQFKLRWTDVADRWMPTTYIVEPLDVIEQISSALVTRAILRPTRSLGFQTREETFHRRVVPHITGTAHAALIASAYCGTLDIPTGSPGGSTTSHA